MDKLASSDWTRNSIAIWTKSTWVWFLLQETYSKQSFDKMKQTIQAVEKTNEAMSETMNSLLIRDEKLDDMLRKTTEMSDISSSIARKVVFA